MKILLKLLIAIWLTSCNAQIQKTQKMIKKLTDIEIKEQGNQIKIEDTIFMKNGKLDLDRLENEASVGGSTLPPYYQYEAHLENGIYLSISGDAQNGFGKSIKYKKDDFFRYVFNYFPTGELRKYGTEYPNFFKKDIWYDYNQDGLIEKYENHEEYYAFSWEDIQLLLKEQKIKKEEITEIHRSNASGNYLWYISFIPKELLNKDKAKVLHVDGKTGEIIKEIIIDISVGLD